ncbi:MAG: ChbG/HpnK family deacetylase [Pirellulaceae bacterium]
MNRVSAFLTLILSVTCVSSLTAQTNWAERLGYPSGKRVVIMHANDLGIAYEFNRPAEAGLQDGTLTSASVISAGPWFCECVEWMKANAGKDIGVTLSFVSPCSVVRWSPVAAREEVPSLAAVDGYFPSTVLQFTVRSELDQVRREAEAQIQRARAAGIQPTHLHPHLGALLTRPDLMQVYLDLAQQMWIPAVMVDFTPGLVDRFRAEGFTISEEMLESVARYPLPKIDDIKNLPPAETYEGKREAFYQTIRELSPGITQIFLNPADDTPALHRMSDQWQDRVWEAQLLADPEVREFLSQQDLVLTNWHEIMKRFEAVNEAPEVEDE